MDKIKEILKKNGFELIWNNILIKRDASAKICEDTDPKNDPYYTVRIYTRSFYIGCIGLSDTSDLYNPIDYLALQ